MKEIFHDVLCLKEGMVISLKEIFHPVLYLSVSERNGYKYVSRFLSSWVPIARLVAAVR